MPWFRVDPVLDATGTLAGRRMASGDAVTGTRRRLDLAPESFVAGPFGRVLLVGTDDGTVSRLSLVDPMAACAVAVANVSEVVRSGVLTPDGTAIVEHRVDRRTRADLGVWRRSLAGEATRRVLPPMAVDPAYGPTFTTELGWGTDGRLVAMSCGQTRCRARIVDPGGSEVRLVEEVGPLVGLAGDTLVVHEPCGGLPCPVTAIELATGRRRTLDPGAGMAVVAGAGRIVTETADGAHLRAIELRDGSAVELADLPAGYGLALSAARGGSALGVPSGWVAALPDGRVPLDVARGGARLIDPWTGSLSTIQEVTP
jgi:hypothetical protein